MEAEIWQWLPEDLLDMILARLPIRVLGKMRPVCKHWNSLLSSRDALQVRVPNWSLHSTPGFLIEIHGEMRYDVQYWVMEGCGSDIYKVPLFNRIVLDTCKGIFCCNTEWDKFDLSIGNPVIMNWRYLPRPPISDFSFHGMAFDSSTRRCTLLLGYSEGQGENRRIEMCIYDSDSNGWTTISMIVPSHIQPWKKGIFSKGKFYWVAATAKPCCIAAFNIADGLWTKIRLPEGCREILHYNLSGYDGQVVVVDNTGVDCLRMWKLDEAEKYEILFELRERDLIIEPLQLFPFYRVNAAVNNSGLIMVIDSKMNMSIFSSKEKLMVFEIKMTSPPLFRSQKPVKVCGSTFESNNLWWP